MSGGAVDQPEGRAGRPDHHRRQRRRASTRRPATPSRWTAMGRRDRRDAQAGQGVSSTASSASASTPSGTNRVDEAPARHARPRRASVQVDDEILAVGDIPVTDFDTLVLAINVDARRRRGPAQDPPRTDEVDRADGRAGQVPGRRRGDRHQPARPPGAGSGSTTRAPLNADRRPRRPRQPMAAAAWSSPRSRTARPPPRAGLKRGQVIRQRRADRRVRNPRAVRRGRRRARRAPSRSRPTRGP